MNDLFGFNQYVNQHYLNNRLNKIHRILLIIDYSCNIPNLIELFPIEFPKT